MSTIIGEVSIPADDQGFDRACVKKDKELRKLSNI